MDIDIRHRPEQHRFEARVDDAGGSGTPAHLDYRQEDGRLTIVHTEVPSTLSGQGIGGALVQAALDHARASGLAVDPQCSYARHYLELHPQPPEPGR